VVPSSIILEFLDSLEGGSPDTGPQSAPVAAELRSQGCNLLRAGLTATGVHAVNEEVLRQVWEMMDGMAELPAVPNPVGGPPSRRVVKHGEAERHRERAEGIVGLMLVAGGYRTGVAKVMVNVVEGTLKLRERKLRPQWCFEKALQEYLDFTVGPCKGCRHGQAGRCRLLRGLGSRGKVAEDECAVLRAVVNKLSLGDGRPAADGTEASVGNAWLVMDRQLRANQLAPMAATVRSYMPAAVRQQKRALDYALGKYFKCRDCVASQRLRVLGHPLLHVDETLDEVKQRYVKTCHFDVKTRQIERDGKAVRVKYLELKPDVVWKGRGALTYTSCKLPSKKPTEASIKRALAKRALVPESSDVLLLDRGREAAVFVDMAERIDAKREARHEPDPPERARRPRRAGRARRLGSMIC
jgi:hypothetical protein